MTCPRTDVLLRDWLLDPRDLDAAHLERCPDCRAAQAELEEAAGPLRRIAAPADFADRVMAGLTMARPRSAAGRRGLAAAGIIVLALLGGFAWAAQQMGWFADGEQVARTSTPNLAVPGLRILAPDFLYVGDLARLGFEIDGSSTNLQWQAFTSENIELLNPDDIGRARRIVVQALRPGQAWIELRAYANSQVARTGAVVQVRSRMRTVTLATQVRLVGAQMRLAAALHPDAPALTQVDRIVLRAIPGLWAEAELGLDDIISVPFGCFEQTTAATFPNLLVLQILHGRSEADRELRERAHAQTAAGARRLLSFLTPSGGFALHPGAAEDPWLTAYGLEELTRLTHWVDVDQEALARAAERLAEGQQADGSFRARFDRQAPPVGGSVAVSAYAARALLASGAQPRAVERALFWLEQRLADPKLDAYEQALIATLLLDLPEPHPALVPLIQRLAADAVAVNEEWLRWSARRTLTGTAGLARDIETTALAVQVLCRSGDRISAERGLAWLLAHRGVNGFAGTQATVQALEAYRIVCLGREVRPSGRILARIDGEYVGSLDVESEAGGRKVEVELGLGGTDPAQWVRRAQSGGLELEFRGQGVLQAQLLVEGQVEWKSTLRSGESSGARPALTLSLRPPGIIVRDRAQTWMIEVANDTGEFLASPMVEFAWPAGFALERPDELDAARAEGILLAYELRLDRLVLYLRHLQRGDGIKLGLLLRAQQEGEFRGPLLRAYPYYQADRESVVAPQTLVVAAMDDKAAPTPVPPAAAVTKEQGLPATETAPEDEDRVDPPLRRQGPSEWRIGWDPALGELDARRPDLAQDTGPLGRLLALALYRALSDVASTRDDLNGSAFNYYFQHASWSDGQIVTAEDYVLSWRAARARLAKAGAALPEHLLIDPFQLVLLHNLVAEAHGPNRLRIRLENGLVCPDLDERLRAFPFLPDPTAIPRLSREACNGGYEIRTSNPDEIVLARRAETLHGPLTIRIRACDPPRSYKKDGRGYGAFWVLKRTDSYHEEVSDRHGDDASAGALVLRLRGIDDAQRRELRERLERMFRTRGKKAADELPSSGPGPLGLDLTYDRPALLGRARELKEHLGFDRILPPPAWTEPKDLEAPEVLLTTRDPSGNRNDLGVQGVWSNLIFAGDERDPVELTRFGYADYLLRD